VSTVFLYTRIFLVGKAKFQQNQPPRIDAFHGNPQIRENNAPIQPDNDHQASSSCYQGHSSSTEVLSSSKLSDNREEQSSSKREQSDNHGEPQDNQAEQSDNREEHSDSQGDSSDNHGEQSNNQGQHSDDQSENSDDQGKQSDNQRGRSNNQAGQSDNPGKRPNNRDGRSNHQGRVLNNQNRKSEQEVSKKLKLAKSCLYVVICSFIAFILPTVFQPLLLSDFHEIVVDTWFTLLVLLNSTLDSLIFFWKNKVLRNEARKVLKNMFS
jgi:DNA mismatch repair ATPase MutL